MSGHKRMGKEAPHANHKASKKANQPAMDLAVGMRIRDLRHDRKLSLESVAAKAKLSVGFLSQIERGLSSPSLRVLAVLADILGVGIAALFGKRASEGGTSVITRAPGRAELKPWRTGICKELLSPAGWEGRLHLFLIHLDPGGNTGDELYNHDGEEAGLVLEGEMTLTVGDETWTLKRGDSFRFESRHPHRFGNPDRAAKAVVLWVNCVSQVS